MREQVTPARGFPSEILEIALGEGDEHKVLLAGKMPGRRLPRLMCGGQVNESVDMIHGGAPEKAVAQGILPRVTLEDLVKESHGS
jgi:hypothetical protein